MRLENKVALITGAGSGIGREVLVVLFAKEGAAVVVADVNDGGGAETVALVEGAGGKAVYVHADVSKAADCAKMVQVAEDTFGKLQVLFNNAGIMLHDDDDAVKTEESVWDLTMVGDLERGLTRAANMASRLCAGPGGGSIINTASFVALMGAATPQLAYTASKGGRFP